MSNTLPKWTEERTAQLEALIAGVSGSIPVSLVHQAAEALETTTRSIAGKLRKLGFTVESMAAASGSKFTDEQAATLREFVTSNSGQYTYSQIAEYFEDGAFSAKSIQGKLLSMELTGHVRPTERVEAPRKYTEEEEARFVKLANSGATVEALAEAMGRTINSVRGKALSLLRSGQINSIPRQESSTAASKEDAFEALGDAAYSMTVEQIAEALNKTPRGVRTMLTRRGITVADYDGAARKEKLANVEAA